MGVIPQRTKSKESILKKGTQAKSIGVNKDYLIKACLMGHTGSGKTQSSITLPLMRAKEDIEVPLGNGYSLKEGDEKHILLIDFDGRAEVVAGLPHIDVINLFDPDPKSPEAWDGGEQLRKELWALAKKGEFPFSGIIEDGLSMMARLSMNSALLLSEKRGLGGAPAEQHWLPQIYYLINHINSIRMLPCHYVLNAHFDLLQEGSTGEIKILPKVTRSLRTEIPGWFNETYYAFREREKKGKGMGTNYYWNTSGTGKYEFFKSTLNTLGKYWEDPVQINFDEEPVGFKLLMQRRFKETS